MDLLNKKKYVISWPYGGIHDILTSTVAWLVYCIKYNRILIVGHTYHWFLDDIQKYITFSHPNIYDGNCENILNQLNTSDSVLPSNC